MYPRPPPTARQKAITRIVIGGAAFAIAVPVIWWSTFALGDQPLSRVRVAGIELPEDRPVDKFLTEQARNWTEEQITVEAGYYDWHPTRQELGTVRPVEGLTERVLSLGRSANPFSNLSDYRKSRRGRLDLPWAVKIDIAAVQAFVDRIRNQVERLPIPGTTGVDGIEIQGQHGERLDGVYARSTIIAALRQGRSKIHLETRITPPPPPRKYDTTGSSATRLFIAKETYYAIANDGRRTNVELAAKFLDGKMILPGATLSFNEVVGERTAARGFGPAQELVNREVVMGIGGGVCQTAATLHGAAFLGGLAIEEFQPHSRLNRYRYIDLGLDAAVAWPNKDLVIRNTYPFPIVVKTSAGPKQMPDGGTRGAVRVELWGEGKPYYVFVDVQEGEPIPPSEQRRIDPDLPPGAERVVQAPHPGVVLTRTRTIVTPLGRIPEITRLRYPPVDRIIAVGPGA